MSDAGGSPGGDGDGAGAAGRGRRVAGVVILVVMVASAAYAGNVAGVRDDAPPPAERLPDDRTAGTDAGTDGDAAAAGGAVDDAAADVEPARRSYPWWDEVAAVDGDGDAETDAFEVRDDALQWRVTWRCDGEGSLTIHRVGEGGERADRPLAESDDCPAEGRGFAVDAATTRLEITSDGAWQAVVEQQVDDPVVEEPTDAMAAGEVVATGEFYEIERRTEGTVEIYDTGDGSFELRLDGPFYATPDSDVEVWVSELDEPQTTREVIDGPTTSVAFLPATTGTMNFSLPDDVDLDAIESVIIWCEPLRLAYGAAPLER